MVLLLLPAPLLPRSLHLYFLCAFSPHSSWVSEPPHPTPHPFPSVPPWFSFLPFDVNY